MAFLSRRKLSEYVASQLLAGDKDIITSLAAFLVEENRTKEAELLIRDIEAALAKSGTVIADVLSARKLSSDTEKAIEAFVKGHSGAKSVKIRSVIDESVIGGIRLGIPGAEMDGTIARKLVKLKASKV